LAEKFAGPPANKETGGEKLESQRKSIERPGVGRLWVFRRVRINGNLWSGPPRKRGSMDRPSQEKPNHRKDKNPGATRGRETGGNC